MASISRLRYPSSASQDIHGICIRTYIVYQCHSRLKTRVHRRLLEHVRIIRAQWHSRSCVQATAILLFVPGHFGCVRRHLFSLHASHTQRCTLAVKYIDCNSIEMIRTSLCEFGVTRHRDGLGAPELTHRRRWFLSLHRSTSRILSSSARNEERGASSARSRRRAR